MNTNVNSAHSNTNPADNENRDAVSAVPSEKDEPEQEEKDEDLENKTPQDAETVDAAGAPAK